MGQLVDYNAWVSLLITDAWVNKLRELITGGKMPRETIFIIGQNNFQRALAMFPLSADFFPHCYPFPPYHQCLLLALQ